jgi:hypothetical protein
MINITLIKAQYRHNKSAKVGDYCFCPSCEVLFIKERKQQAFCKTKTGTKCKDKYWNTVIETKRNNTTRISPASARWTAQQFERKENLDFEMHPFEGLNDEEYKNH